jgi:hypothetical protein
MTADKSPPLPDSERIAPVQGYSAGIPWSIHLEAYDAYCKRHSKQQALIEGGCRGGFGVQELDSLIPGWRDRVSEIGRLRTRIAELEQRLAALTDGAEPVAWLVDWGMHETVYVDKRDVPFSKQEHAIPLYTAPRPSAALDALVKKWRESARGAKQYATTEYEDGCVAAESRCADELESALSAVSAAPECQHEWQHDPDVAGASYCPRCEVTRRATPAPAESLEVGFGPDSIAQIVTDLRQVADTNAAYSRTDLTRHFRSFATRLTTLRAVSGGREKRWPFVESPGEFTERLHRAMQEFPLIGAVRHVLIENPPVLTTPAAPALSEGMLDRIKAAEQRIIDGRAPRRIPADVTDVDLVLAEVIAWAEGEPPPFWLAAAPQREDG